MVCVVITRRESHYESRYRNENTLFPAVARRGMWLIGEWELTTDHQGSAILIASRVAYHRDVDTLREGTEYPA